MPQDIDLSYLPIELQQRVRNAFYTDPASRLDEIFRASAGKDPANVARAIEIASQLDVTPDAVMAEKLTSGDITAAPPKAYWKWLHEYRPITTDFISDPYRMTAVRDILDDLDRSESWGAQRKRELRLHSLTVRQSELEWERMMSALISGQMPQLYNGELSAIEQELAQLSAEVDEGFWLNVMQQPAQWAFMAKHGATGAAIGGTIGGVGSGVAAILAGNAGPQALIPEEVVTVPTAVVGGAKVGAKIGGKLGAAKAMVMLEGGSAFRELSQMRDDNGDPIDPRLAAAGALAVGLINGGMEYLSMSTFLKLLTVVPGAKQVLSVISEAKLTELAKQAGKNASKSVILGVVKNYLVSLITEAGTETGQEASPQIVANVLKSISRQPFTAPETRAATAKEIWQRSTGVIVPTIQSTAFWGAITGGIGLGINAVQNTLQVQQAERNAQTYRAAGQVAAQSQLLDRTSTGYRDHMAEVLKGSPLETVYVDPEPFVTLLQSAAEEQGQQSQEVLRLAARELGVSDTEMQQALESGTPIAVPYAAWLQQTAKTPAYNALEEHVRFSPDGLTLAQAKSEEQRIDQITEQEQLRAQELIAESEQNQAGYQLVYDDIRSKLQAAGRPEGQFTARRWDAYIDKSARLWAAHAVTEAARRGITVEQWYQGTNRPEIRRGQVDTQGLVLNQQALHASLADFDRFSLEKIGTGVGQNLKGWGLNFTTSVALRDYYRQMFEQYRAEDGQKAIGYRVNIAEDSDLMNWETSLGEQPAKVQQAVEKVLEAHPELDSLGNINAREFYYALAETLGGTKEASLALRNAGIPGHSYVMDAHEYGKVKNFVIYDEQSIEIKGKEYFQSGVNEQSASLPQNEAENIERGTAAMEEVIENHTDFLNAMYRQEVGGISFYWGEPGQAPEFKKGSGISKIIAKCTFEGLDGEAVARKMVEVLAKGELGEVYGPPEGQRVNIGYDGHTAVLSLYRDKNLQTWLLTGWKNDTEVSVDSGEGDGSAGPTLSEPMRTRPGEGAETSVDDIIPKPGTLFHRIPQTQTEAFKAWFGDSQVVDENGQPLVVYHGTQRPDRIGDRFRKDRATSGPMSFFTDNAEIASNYATGKQDTSLTREDTSYENWYQVKVRGKDNPVNIVQAWHSLSAEERRRISELAPRITENDDGDIYLAGPEHKTGLGGYTWQIKEAKGNALAALVDAWLNDGTLYNNEDKFAQVLDLAGLKDYQYDPPNASYPGVYPVYLAIRNPFDTANIPDDVVQALEKHSQTVQFEDGQGGADMWDKESRRPEDWIQMLRDDIAGGTTRAWTSIPDWVTDTLKELGYDGIKDAGGKLGGLGHTVWIPFEETQVKSATGNRGTFGPNNPSILLQGDKNTPRGAVHIGQSKSVIALLQAADPSTFLHESAHLWLNDMFEYVRSGQANESYLADWKTLSGWLQVADTQAELTTEQQEKFSRGFETYLMEGKAPSRGLRKVFAALKQWMIRVYRSVVPLNAPMSDAVRGVMDRMLATEEEIRQAEAAEAADQQLIGEADVAPEVLATLDDYRARAHEQATAQLLKSRMEEMTAQAIEKMEDEWIQTKDAVSEEMAVEPLFAAQQDLLSFMGADTDLRSLASMYRRDTLHTKVRERFERIAENYGLSGDELACKILDGQTIREELQRRTEQRMEAQHPELLPENLRATAQAAIHNEARSELIALENAILQEMVSKAQAGAINRRAALQRAQVMSRAAWSKAREILSRTNYKEATDATKYFAAERDAAVKAALAKQRGDLTRAQKYAEQRMVAHALAREALKNKVEVDKIFRYIQPLTKHGRSLMNMPKEFVFQIDALLGRFGFGPGPEIAPGDIVESLSDFAARMKDEYHELPFSSTMFAEAYRKPYQELTLGELRDLHQALKSLARMGRNYNSFLSLFKGADIRIAGAETRASIAEQVGNPRAHEKYIGSGKGSEKALSISDEIAGWLVKPEFYARFLDGDQDGPFQNYFLRPLKQARDAEQVMREKIMHDLSQLFKPFYTVAEMREMTKKKSEKYIKEIGRNLTRENIILFALNQGNEMNKQRAKDGFATPLSDKTGLTDAQVDAILSYMTEKDWQLAQSVWDYVDTYWDEIKKLEEEVTGVTPEKVEATPVVTPYGTLRGGYFPIAYDPGKSSAAATNEAQLNALYKEMPAARAATRQGHTKQRAQHVERPILLTWGVLTRHLNNVAHDLTHRRAIIDANRFLKNRDVRTAVESAVGQAGYRSLENALKAIAADQGDSLTPLDKVVRWSRTHTTMFALGGNLRLALLQLSGVHQSAWEIGAIPTMRGIGNFIANPQQTWKTVHEKSTFMANRGQTFDRDVYDYFNKMFKKDRSKADFAFCLAGFADQLWTVPMWMESYRMALAEGLTEQDAIARADGHVERAAGSGTVLGQSAAQRGPEIQKLMTMFYSYGNQLANLYWLNAKRAGVEIRQGQTGAATKRIAAMVAYGWILPGIFEWGIREILRQKRGDEEPEDVFKRLVAALPSGLLQTIPLLRDIASAFINRQMGIYDEFSVTPVEDSINDALDTIDQAKKALVGEGDPMKAVESVAETGAYSAGIPKQIVTWVFNILDWITGEGAPAVQDLFTRRPKR